MTFKHYISILFSDIFCVTLTLYTGILFAELLKKGVVVEYVNTTTLLVVMACSGILAVIFPHGDDKRTEWTAYAVCGLIGAYIGFLVYSQTVPMAPWSYLFGISAGLVTFVCSGILCTLKSDSSNL